MKQTYSAFEKYRVGFQRFIALLIDGLVFSPLIFVGGYIFGSNFSDSIIIVWLIFHTSVSYLYNIILHTFFGQTIGKMLTGIKVLDVSETPITFRQSVYRDIIPLILGVIFLCGDIYTISTIGIEFVGNSIFYVIMTNILLVWAVLELVSMLTNEKRRSIHDFIAGTVVVRVNKK
jgi:uncharacterized RDD family membrane protein YckC